MYVYLFFVYINLIQVLGPRIVKSDSDDIRYTIMVCFHDF